MGERLTKKAHLGATERNIAQCEDQIRTFAEKLAHHRSLAFDCSQEEQFLVRLEISLTCFIMHKQRIVALMRKGKQGVPFTDSHGGDGVRSGYADLPKGR
jgi:hypothetical protein